MPAVDNFDNHEVDCEGRKSGKVSTANQDNYYVIITFDECDNGSNSLHTYNYFCQSNANSCKFRHTAGDALHEKLKERHSGITNSQSATFRNSVHNVLQNHQGVCIENNADGFSSHLRTISHPTKASTKPSIHLPLPFGYGGWRLQGSQRFDCSLRQRDKSVKDALQMKAYVVWVNAQLKKKPGTRPVEELNADMHDGVTLADLIEVIAGERLDGIIQVPVNNAEKIKNVDCVLKFVRKRKIRMHEASAADIVNGDVKVIMRVVLALAAHFKPNNVRLSKQRSVHDASKPSVAGIVQGAAAALADARRDASGTVTRSHPMSPLWQGSVDREAVSRQSSLAECQLPYSQSVDFFGLEACSSSAGRDEGPCLSRPASSISEDIPAAENDAGFLLGNFLPQFRGSLLQLQKLLLDGHGEVDMGASGGQCLPGGDIGDPAQSVEQDLQGEMLNEEVVILRSRLQQAEHANIDLREEVSRLRMECIQLQGTKVGYQERVAEQNAATQSLRAELSRAEFGLKATKEEFEKKLVEKDEQISSLIANNMPIANLSSTSEELVSRAHHSIDVLRSHWTEPASGNALSTNQNRAEELEAFDVLEGSIASLIEQMRRSQRVSTCVRTPRRRTSNQDSVEDGPAPSCQSSTQDSQVANCGSQLEGPTSAATNGTTGPKTPRQRMPANVTTPTTTKVVYFTPTSTSPCVCVVNNRLGQVTLMDIKKVIDTRLKCRYLFKVRDKQLGTVRQEVSHDDDFVPGWEGKIVVWLDAEDGC